MDLIYIKHPIDIFNIKQEEYLLICIEEQKYFHALMFNFGNAIYKYYQIEPTREDYKVWLLGLNEDIRNSFTKLGYEKSKSSIPLKRFANEIRDNGMDEYLKKLLTPDDYQAYQKLGKDSLL